MKTEKEEFQEAKARFIEKLSELGKSEFAAEANNTTTTDQLIEFLDSLDLDTGEKTQLQMSLNKFGPGRTYIDSMK